MLAYKHLLKKVWIYRFEIGAGLLIAGAAALRILLVLLSWPGINSDEAMNNLAALHIARNGEHPIFFYGQNYLGNFEAYFGSLLFRIFEPSVQLMRLGMVALTILFLICLYLLTRKLYSRGLALVVLACLFFGSQWTLQNQIEAGGYPELPLFAVLLCFIACTLSLSYYRLSTLKRCLLYALWGLVAGVALWIQLLIAPYILVSGLLILVMCWQDFFKRALWCILPAFLIGAAPFIYYNLTAAPGQDSLHVFLSLSHMGYNPHDGLIFRLERGILTTLPVATGATPFCTLNGFHPLHCLLIQGPWGLGYVALALLSILLSVVALRKIYRLDSSPERHQQVALHFGRLMLLAGVGISLASLIQGNALNLSATTSWRYLICCEVSLPAVLWPLWIYDQWFPRRWQRDLTFALKWSIIALVVLVLTRSTVLVFQQNVPGTQQKNQRIAVLEQTLEHLHITRFYSEYWTCEGLIFATQEQLICANTYSDLSHGFDRYLPYRTIVEQDPHPGFVFPTGAPQITALDQRLAQSHVIYQRIEIPGYVIYKLNSRIPGLDL